MWILIVVIISIWVVALGTAYLCRVSAGLSKRLSAVIVTGSYFALSAPTLVWFGFNITGLFAVSGMLLPFAVAILATTRTAPPHRRA